MARGFNIGGGTETCGGDATALDILLGKTAYVQGNLVTGEIPTQAATTITPSVNDQTATPGGTYMSGNITVNAIPNQKAATTITPSANAQTVANAGTYMAGNLTLAAIPNQKAATTITPKTTAQTAANAGTYMTGALTCGAIPDQTTGGAKYATTSAQTILAANKWLTSALTIGALSQTNLAAANIVRGKTITISNGSGNVWSVGGSANTLKVVSGHVTGSTVQKTFYNNDGSVGNTHARCTTITNHGITPAIVIWLGNSSWGIREGSLVWRVWDDPSAGTGAMYYNSSKNSGWRFTSSALDLWTGKDNADVYYWIFGY